MRVNYHKFPEQFAETLARQAGRNLILGLDLGTTTGMAFHYWRPGDPITVLPQHMGQWDLSAGPFDSGAIRFVRLRQFLSFVKPDLVAFEDVRYTPSSKVTKFNATALLARAATSAELFGAFKATVCTWCEENGVPCCSFSIQHIKKRATMKGNANKEMVIKACNAEFGTDFDVEGYETSGVDNIADSSFCCILAMESYAAGLPLGDEQESPSEEAAKDSI